MLLAAVCLLRSSCQLKAPIRSQNTWPHASGVPKLWNVVWMKCSLMWRGNLGWTLRMKSWKSAWRLASCFVSIAIHSNHIMWNNWIFWKHVCFLMPGPSSTTTTTTTTSCAIWPQSYFRGEPIFTSRFSLMNNEVVFSHANFSFEIQANCIDSCPGKRGCTQDPGQADIGTPSTVGTPDFHIKSCCDVSGWQQYNIFKMYIKYYIILLLPSVVFQNQLRIYIYFEYNIIYIHVSIDIICFNHQDGLEAIRHEERAAAAARQATTLGLWVWTAVFTINESQHFSLNFDSGRVGGKSEEGPCRACFVENPRWTCEGTSQSQRSSRR